MRVLLSALSILGAAAAVDVQARQVHLALAGDGAVRVAYFTVNASAATCSFGVAGGALNSTATGSTVSYLTDGGFHHVVRLSGLAPGVAYTYVCGAPGATSPPATFTAAPAAGSAHAFSAVVFGDWGWLNSSVRGAMLPVGGLDSNWTASPAYELLGALAPAADLTWIVGDIACVNNTVAAQPRPRAQRRRASTPCGFARPPCAGTPTTVSATLMSCSVSVTRKRTMALWIVTGLAPCPRRCPSWCLQVRRHDATNEQREESGYASFLRRPLSS